MKAVFTARILRHAASLVGGLLPSVAIAQANYATPYAFTTVAGAAPGSTDGTGSAARFNFSTIPGTGTGPAISQFFLAIGTCCLASDSSGNLYVADSLNDTIRKITPAGAVTTLAGLAGTSGSSDGTGTAARFWYPLGVAADSAGNVYVSDTQNLTVRKITPAGVVTTLAGTVGLYNANGDGGVFDSPTGLAVDPAGNVYVADTGANAIFKVAPGGSVSVLAGDVHLFGVGGYADGTGTAAQFKAPYGLALDGSGNLYVADTGNEVIRKVTPSGVVTTLAGVAGKTGSADGSGTSALFNNPSALAIDSAGNLYVADADNRTIREISPSGAVTTLAGEPGVSGDANGMGSAALFLNPLGLAVGSSGNVFVADNDAIREVSPSGEVTGFAGALVYGSNDGTGAEAQFDWPTALAVDGEGNAYVADTLNGSLRKIAPGGVVTTVAKVGDPFGVAVDGSGNIYVSESQNGTICKVTAVRGRDRLRRENRAAPEARTVRAVPPNLTDPQRWQRMAQATSMLRIC